MFYKIIDDDLNDLTSLSFSELRRKGLEFQPPAILARRSNSDTPKFHAPETCASILTCTIARTRKRIRISSWPRDSTYCKENSNNLLSQKLSQKVRKVTNFGVRQSVHKVARQKGISSGRTYTSRYRGVHQTFPTRRWEAQFRRNGKPTSLGCFDREEEAARAYDRMMVWCELHVCENRVAPKSGLKPGFASLPLNFDCGEYENDYEGLRKMTQDELVQNLRRQGRLQATTNNFGG
ncbi:uncharacterized protein MICPUCDRAFT_55167 [Micromonas pusilla CCMP1545]|uniref:Predicted protein n=1 Tax=Micromonas pusilla (strain CCMP1545) TaxID=564608 RepID=C1MK01_MICPC|nr:uncharacterized protein MICPUCDRAFT_55167 [Micromonas pusilla CCMP1545]EEH59283.1 predicted protein [Micromonas pusilla CCMP1545]|eukprot:XP_003055907.1 predicted protein [Micromonas pusilla CCMP1545]